MTGRDTTADDKTDAAPSPRRGIGLSGKLLLLTLLFATVTQVLIYVPTIANFRLSYLNDRLAAAYTAALVLEAAPSGMVPESVARDVLESVGARAVAIKMGTQRRLLAASELQPEQVRQDVDMRAVSFTSAVMDAFHTLFCRDNDLLRVVGPAPRGGDFLEIVLEEQPLRAAMLRFSVTVLLISLLISTITGALVYFSLDRMLVRPMRRLTANMTAFHRDPENPDRIIAPSARGDEIGGAERELASMQRDLASMLHQKSRLAALGLAVSKINHDLRNLLTPARLVSEALATVPDPRVQRFAPKLMRSIERAIDLCQSTLSYGRVKEPEPVRRAVDVAALIEEVREALAMADHARIGWIVSVERGLTADADSEQLLRVLLNLVRNAAQALESRAPNEPLRDQIHISGKREGAVVLIEVADTGPGIPAKAREHLFEAFQNSSRSGGSGLGLAIAAELIRAHRGDIELLETASGATFRLTLPDRAVELDAHRSERTRA